MQSNGPEPADEHDPGTERPPEAEAEVVEAVPEPDPRDARIVELEARLAETEGRLRAVSKAYTDQRNEMTAFRERMEAQDRLRVERKEFEVVETFFEPVQNLDRSIEVGITDPESFLEGLKMVHHQFMETLHRLGLDEVPGAGATFDPRYHEALAVAPVDDPEQHDKVLSVHVRGWTVKGKLLKAAQVVIGRHQPQAHAQTEPAEA